MSTKKLNNIGNNETAKKFNINYQIALENYSNSVKFFTKYKQIIEEIEKIINSYKDIVKDFQAKLLQLNGDLLKHFNNKEKFAFDNDNNIFPILKKNIKYINNIFALQIYAFTKQINFLEKKNLFNLSDLCLHDKLNTLNENRTNFQKEEKKMENVMKDYDREYSELMNTLQDSEDTLKKFFVKKRKDTIRKKKSNKNVFDSTIVDALNAEEDFYKVYVDFSDNNNSYFDYYDQYLKDLENEMANISNNINKDFHLFISVIIDNYNDITNKLNQMNEKINISQENKIQKIEENIENKNNIIKDDIKEKEEEKNTNQEFNLFMSKHLKKFERKYIKEKYKVKAIHEKVSDNKLSTKTKNIMNSLGNEFSMENLFVDNTIVLSEEDVYEITKTFYGPFQFVNKSEYDLSIEKKKIDFKNLTNKLLYFGLKKKNLPEFDELKPITDEEITKLENGLKKKEYRIPFLQRLNDYRSLGIFDIPEKEYEIIVKFFKLMINMISEEKEKDENDILVTNFIIVLSQTFYVDKNGEKCYLINELKGNKIFEDKDYWEKYIKYHINEDIDRVINNLKNNKLKNSTNAYRDIGFSLILSFCNNMIQFEMPKEILLKIVEPLYKEYQITEEMKATIDGIIQPK